MSERVAIVGSREYADEQAVRAYVRGLPGDTVLVTGGARGVDTWAEDEARKRGLEVVVYLPDWHTHGRAAGPIRNKHIMEDVSRAAAFWDGASRGTASAIEIGRSLGKPIEVIRSVPGSAKEERG